MKTVLFAIIFCLFVTTAAKAECAWVLWQKYARMGDTSWEILEAYPKDDQCKEA